MIRTADELTDRLFKHKIPKYILDDCYYYRFKRLFGTNMKGQIIDILGSNPDIKKIDSGYSTTSVRGYHNHWIYWVE